GRDGPHHRIPHHAERRREDSRPWPWRVAGGRREGDTEGGLGRPRIGLSSDRHGETVWKRARRRGRGKREQDSPRRDFRHHETLEQRPGIRIGVAGFRREPTRTRSRVRGLVSGPLAGAPIAERILGGACEDPGARIGTVDRGEQLHDSASGGTPTCNPGPAIGEPGRVPSVPLSARTPRIWPEASHPAGGVRPTYELPGNLRPASLAERRRFYADKMDYRAAATWMARPTGGRVYALILGRHSGIYPPRFRHLKNVPLTIDDAEDVRELRPYLLRYRPEGVYYDRNVYAPLEATRRAQLDYAHAWRSRFFRGQELAFDLDPENLDCP